jgi:hypothetical protein
VPSPATSRSSAAFAVALAAHLALAASCQGPFVNDRSTDRISGQDAVYDVNSPVGSSARALLAAEPFRSVRVEIQHVAGQEIDSLALAHVRAFLQRHLSKPRGITFAAGAIPSPGRASLTLDQVRELADQSQQRFTRTDQVVIHVLSLDAESPEDESSRRVLGAAYRNTSVVLYGRSVNRLSGEPGQPLRWVLQASILEHELGHLLGLVNTGTPAYVPHEDGAFRNHCANPLCLMNENVQTTVTLESPGVGASPQGRGVPELDADCLADLKAASGR